MNSEAIFNAAHSTAIRLLESGAFISPADTVCSIQTASGRIFTGISRTDMNSTIHAEIDAVQNMLAAGENIIEGLLLINTQSRTPMLPCNNCIGYIMSLAPANAGCMIMMPDRMISLSEVGMFAAPMGNTPEPNRYGGHAPGAPQPQYTAHAKASPIAVAARPATNTAASPLAAAPVPRSSGESVSMDTNTVNAKGDMLKNRVNSLLKVAEEPETDEFLDSLPSPKKRFGFFKK
ncbi:cytidine deaminase [Ruminococcus flavefaciens]|uniref:cytidine deaminase n=1 Tax=Ruminococcus flavefaciens TaxID=1265 RepID=UPI000465C36B|nr:cytidine deaminase [Ruminococcus flavefaciens]